MKLSIERRYQQVLRAVSSGLLSKGTNLLVNLVLVPLMVRHLGSESYGLWITITGTVSMFVLLDIGIANTLTNLISEAYAADNHDLAAEYFSSAFWTVCAVSVIMACSAALAWPYIDWPSLFHVSDPSLRFATAKAVAVALFLLLWSLPAGLAARLLAGYQEMHFANIFTGLGSLGSLGGVLIGLHLHAGLAGLVAATPPRLWARMYSHYFG